MSHSSALWHWLKEILCGFFGYANVCLVNGLEAEIHLEKINIFITLFVLNIFLAFWAMAVHRVSGNDICTLSSLIGQGLLNTGLVSKNVTRKMRVFIIIIGVLAIFVLPSFLMQVLGKN